MDKDRILIVDDEEVNRAILANIFEEQYEVLEAANGAEAVELIEDNYTKLKVVFLDLMMPVMDGFGVLAYMSAGHTDHGGGDGGKR